MNFGEVLGRAWKVLWKFKVLWLFSVGPYLIYALGMVLAAIFFFSRNNLTTFTTTGFINDWLPLLGELFWLGFNLLFLVINLFGVIATVVGVSKADGGAEKLSFQEAVGASLAFFWRAIGLDCLFFAGLLGIVLVMMGCMVLATIGTMGYGMLCIFPLFFLVIPLELVGAALLELSTAAIVVQRTGTIGGLQLGWALLKNNFWKVVLMGLILYGGMYILSMISASPMYVVSFLTMSSFMGSNNGQSFFNGMLLVIAVAMPVYMIFTGALMAYIRTAWTLTYLRLAAQPAAAVESASA